MYKFFAIFSLLLLISARSFAADVAKQPVQSDQAIEEHKPFIEKGTASLPIAPEISKKNINLPDLPPPEPIIDTDLAKIASAEKAAAEKAKAGTTPVADTNPQILPEKQEALPSLSATPAPTPTVPVEVQAIAPPVPVTVPSPKLEQAAPTPVEVKTIAPPVPAPAPKIAAPAQVIPEAAKPVTPSPAAPIPAPVEVKTIISTAPKIEQTEQDTAIAKRPANPITNAPAAKAPQRIVVPKPIIVGPKQAVKASAALEKKEVIDPVQIRFVKDESLLLMFDDDDIILGALSTKAGLEQMEGSKYIRLVEEFIAREKNRDLAKKNIWFILKHSTDAPVMLPKKYLVKTAILDIEKSNLTDLRVLADNYPILDMLDKNGNSLLHIATFNNNPSIAKWLVMRNININMPNNNSESALYLAEQLQYWEIFNLLEKAGAE